MFPETIFRELKDIYLELRDCNIRRFVSSLGLVNYFCDYNRLYTYGYHPTTDIPASLEYYRRRFCGGNAAKIVQAIKSAVSLNILNISFLLLLLISLSSPLLRKIYFFSLSASTSGLRTQVGIWGYCLIASKTCVKPHLGPIARN